MSEYVIEYGRWHGTCLGIGRVPRQRLDKFIAEHPEPDPPLKKVVDLGIEVWGDPDERIPDHDNAEYLVAREVWNRTFSLEMVDLIASTITVPIETEAAALLELEEMRALKLIESGGAMPSLLALLDERDQKEIVEQIFYNSTVTIRGLVEAAKAYNVRWDKKKVPVAGRLRGPAQASSIFEARLVATWVYLKWPEFCELTGAEQSAHVALYRYKNKLSELAARKT